MTSDDLEKLYDTRFSEKERVRKDRVWKVLCESYFQQFVKEDGAVLDVACGLGEFVRHIRAARRVAVDINPAVARELPPDVEFICASAESIPSIADRSIDVCFASNFFEHLPSKAAMDGVLQEARRMLRPGGRFVCMQPNIRYAGGRYWDFYDHVLPLSHKSAAEGFAKNGYIIERLIPRFVPFTTKSAFPQNPALVRAYLWLPFLWRIFGGQFVLVARRD
jgi:ubiquinone/menaquinone biosynthesis C-methylase UbiE